MRFSSRNYISILINHFLKKEIIQLEKNNVEINMNILETRLNETKKNYELEKIQHLEKLVSNEEKIVRYISSPLFESWIMINLYF